MSLILEALRKSEAERQRAQVPGLHAPVPAPIVRRVAPAWGPWVAGLLGVGLLVGTWWVGREEPAPVGAVPPEVVVPEKPLPEPPIEPAVANEAPVQTPAPTPPAPVVEAPPPRAEVPTPAPAPPPEPVAIRPEPVETPPAPPPAEALPGLASLSTTERAALPALKVSMHVWHADAARRFAIVDGNRVGEGSVLGGGIVAAIRPDGVVLELNDGRRVLLARP